MSHRYIEEEATSDIAFEATGKDLSEVFRPDTPIHFNPGRIAIRYDGVLESSDFF